MMKWTIPKIITVSALSGALLIGAAGGRPGAAAFGPAGRDRR